MLRVSCVLTTFLLACGSSPPSAPKPVSNTTPERAEDPGTDVSFAGIRRTYCMGRCPVYEVHAFRDGTVEYAGEYAVKTQGKATGQITPAQISELDALFASTGFMQLRDAYADLDETDAPSVYTSYRPTGGLEKTVHHYYGDSDAPKVLETIETGVDRILHVEQWIGTEDERRALFSH